MFTLIKQEIRDHIVYFLAGIILTAILIVITLPMIYLSFRGEHGLYARLYLPVSMILMISFSGMGVSQMYTDRARKISAFLSTLPVSRSQILLAKITTGILAILIVVILLIIATMAMEYIFALPIPIFSNMDFDIFAVIFLLAFACYCLGLMTGWTASKITSILGYLALACILASLIIVKGFGPSAKGILILFILACLTRTWQKFTSTSL